MIPSTVMMSHCGRSDSAEASFTPFNFHSIHFYYSVWWFFFLLIRILSGMAFPRLIKSSLSSNKNCQNAFSICFIAIPCSELPRHHDNIFIWPALPLLEGFWENKGAGPVQIHHKGGVVITSTAPFPSILCPCQNQTESVRWCRCPATGCCGATESCPAPGSCRCASRDPNPEAGKENLAPRSVHRSKGRRHPQTTLARISGGFAHSTWPGWWIHLHRVSSVNSYAQNTLMYVIFPYKKAWVNDLTFD